MKFLKKIVLPLFLTAAISLSAQTKVSCILGDTIALNLSGTRGAIQWQISNDSLTWTDLVGQQSEQLEFISSLPTQWLRASISENNCPVFYENSILINAIDTSLSGFESNIIVMDTVLVQFTPDSIQQLDGIYQYSTNEQELPIKPGDIIIGTEDEGYLKFVDNYILQNGIVIIHTHQATLDDIFNDESFTIEMLMDSLEQRNLGVDLTIGETVIFSNPFLEFRLSDGTISISGDASVSIDYSLFDGLEYFDLETNFIIDSDLHFNLNTSQGSVSIPTPLTVPLAKFAYPFRFNVGEIPVIGMFVADVLLEFKAEGQTSPRSYSARSVSQATLTGNLIYENNVWSKNADFSGVNSDIDLDGDIGTTGLGWKIGLTAKVSPKFYGNIFAAYVKGGTYLKQTVSTNNVTHDWDQRTVLFGEVTSGVDLELPFVIKQIPIIESYLFQSDPWFHHSSPYDLVLESGDNQIANVNSNYTLPEPIVVIVRDTFGIPQQGVHVYAEVVSGGGTIQQADVVTDVNGKAIINWTLAAGVSEHELKISARKSDLTNLVESPLLVHAAVPDVLDLTFSGYIQPSQTIWNTESTTLHATGGVPPYEYNFFENCDSWSTDSVIQYPADGIVIDSCGNQNFLYGGQYAMRVRDAAGTMDTVLVYIDRERAVVNTTTTGCNSAPGATWLLYAGISISSPNACFDLQEGSLLSAWIFSSAIPDWWYGGGFGGGLGFQNNWNDIASSETPWAGLKVDYGINGSCLTSYNTFVTFYTNNTAPTCPGASCSYRVRFFGPNATNAASPYRWIWSNVITHTW